MGVALSLGRQALTADTGSRTDPLDREINVKTREATTLRKGRPTAGDENDRDREIARHLPLVYHIARRMLPGLSDEVELDDLVSAGGIGLMRAIESFDASRGLAFSTYASARIRGAILDDLRENDRLSRASRRKQKRIAEAEATLTSAFDRTPTDYEVADRLGIDVETVWVWRNEASDGEHISLSAPVRSDGGRAMTAADVVPGATGEEIEEGVDRDRLKQRLHGELSRLDERERMILGLYYSEDLSQSQIAEVLDLTESRISQIRCKALNTLRGRMTDVRESAA
jgi:RNA polymerase sigma factor for flagellar operon FliA